MFLRINVPGQTSSNKFVPIKLLARNFSEQTFKINFSTLTFIIYYEHYFTKKFTHKVYGKERK